jgi:hypothetical protein
MDKAERRIRISRSGEKFDAYREGAYLNLRRAAYLDIFLNWRVFEEGACREGSSETPVNFLTPYLVPELETISANGFFCGIYLR